MQTQEIKTPVILTLVRNITIALLSFISFPFAAQALGNVAMGAYSWANTFVYYFLIISRLGIPTIAIRECAKVKDDKEKLSDRVQTFFVLQLITTALSFILMSSILFIGGNVVADPQSRSLIFLLSINFLVGVFSFEWVFIALDKVFFMSLRSVFLAVLGTILIIVFVQNDHDLFTYAFINITSTILIVIINFIVLRKEKLKFSLKRKIDFKYLTKSLLFVFGITFLITAYNQNDSILLGYLDPSKSVVGSYAVGVRGIEIIITIITSLSSVFMVRTTVAYKNNDLKSFHQIVQYSFNIIFFIAVPAVLFMIGLAPEIVGFIVKNDTYWTSKAIQDAVVAVTLLASMMLSYSLHDSIYQQVLVPLQKEKHYFFTMLAVLIFNIVASVLLSLFVFPNNILFAVALVTIISEVIALIVVITLSKKYTFKHIFNLNNLKIIASGAVALTVGLLLKPLFSSFDALVVIGLVIGIGGIIYLGLLYLLREDIVHKKVKAGENNG